MQFSCCGRENSSSTQLAHTQLRGRSRSRKETLLVEPVTIGISCLMVLVCSCRRAKGSPFQRAESDWQAHRHLHRGLVLSTEGRRTRLGAECPLLEKENFSPVWNQEMQNTPSCYGHHLELEMVRLWSSQLLCGAPGMLCLKTVAFLYLTALTWLTPDKPTLNVLSLRGGGGFSPSGLLNSSVVLGSVAQHTKVSSMYKAPVRILLVFFSFYFETYLGVLERELQFAVRLKTKPKHLS